MRLFLTIFFFSLSCSAAYAQKEASIWYLGGDIGIDFRSGSPKKLFGLKPTLYGRVLAAISDPQGNLMCYTGGDSIWTGKNIAIANIGYLTTGGGATVSHIIPWPGIANRYMIITNGNEVESSFFRTTIEVDPDRKRGRVLEENKIFYSPTVGGHSVVSQANGQDVWLLTHGSDNDEFLSFPITAKGIMQPVVTKIGRMVGYRSGNLIRCLKFSPNGKTVATLVVNTLSTPVAFYLETYDFDNRTGKLTNNKLLTFTDPQPFSPFQLSFEFSPNSRFLYIPFRFGIPPPPSSNKLLQFDLRQPTSLPSIIGNTPGFEFQMQLATDGKIYMNGLALGVVERPNKKGLEAGLSALDFEVPNSTELPRFNQSYFLPPTGKFDMPNVFTPNGDTFNPKFVPIASANVESGNLKIINRWGEVVFLSDNVFEGWDGANSPEGVYYWVIEFEGSNGEYGRQKGWVQLVR